MVKPSLVEASAEIMHGIPVFTATRVPVKTLFDYLIGGDTLADFLDDFPTVNREIAVEVLELAGRKFIDAATAGRVAAEETQNPIRAS